MKYSLEFNLSMRLIGGLLRLDPSRHLSNPAVIDTGDVDLHHLVDMIV